MSRVLTLVVLLLLSGCGGAEAGGTCTDGTTVACACDDGGEGRALCAGGRLEPCACAGPVLLVSGAALDPGGADGRLGYGPVPVGGEAARTLVIENGGAGRLVVDVGGAEPPFAVEPTRLELGPGERADVTVRFAPGAARAFTGALAIAGGGRTVRIALDGDGFVPLVVCGPDVLDFGEVRVGGVAAGAFACRNDGAAGLDLAVGTPGDPAFRLPGTPGWLAPGASVVVDVEAAPEAEGPIAAALPVRAAAGGPELATVELRARGVRHHLTVEPAALDFGFVLPGEQRNRPLRLENVGDRPLSIAVALAPGAAPAFRPGAVPAVLRPGDAVELPVAFEPAERRAHEGVLVVTSDDPVRGEVRVPLAGTGGGPVLRCEARRIDFGTAATGMRLRRVFSCANEGEHVEGLDDALRVDGVRVEGSSAFSGRLLAEPPFAAGARFEVEVAYAPERDRVDQGVLVFDGNDAGSDPPAIALSGTGRVLGACGARLLAPELDFGRVEPGTSRTLEFAVAATGVAGCLVRDLGLAACDAFTLPGGPIDERLLAPGETLRVPVTFAPDLPGPATCALSLQVSDPDGERTVALRGEGGEACVVLDPEELVFGEVGRGCSSAERNLVVRNGCTRPVTVTSIELQGGLHGGFRPLAAPALPATLEPAGSLAVGLRFVPAVLGEDRAVVALRSDAGAAIATVAGAGVAAGTTVVERFRQNERPKVDLLWVIENTAAMAPFRTAIDQNLDVFLSFAQAQEIDFRFAVTTTGLDPDPRCAGPVQGGEDGRILPLDGSGPRWIGPTTPRAQTEWSARHRVETCHGNPRGLDAAVTALTAPLATQADDPRHPEPDDGNAGFLREGAHLTVIFLGASADRSVLTPVEAWSALARIRGLRRPDLLNVHAIVGPEGGCQAGGAAAEAGTRYRRVAEYTDGGVVQSICARDWETSLREMSSAAFGFKTCFPLTGVPVDVDGDGVVADGELTVLVDGRVTPSMGAQGQRIWKFVPEPNFVCFFPLAVPEPGLRVEIEYDATCE